jgi:hypothetical protein
MAGVWDRAQCNECGGQTVVLSIHWTSRVESFHRRHILCDEPLVHANIQNLRVGTVDRGRNFVIPHAHRRRGRRSCRGEGAPPNKPPTAGAGVGAGSLPPNKPAGAGAGAGSLVLNKPPGTGAGATASLPNKPPSAQAIRVQHEGSARGNSGQ